MQVESAFYQRTGSRYEVVVTLRRGFGTRTYPFRSEAEAIAYIESVSQGGGQVGGEVTLPEPAAVLPPDGDLGPATLGTPDPTDTPQPAVVEPAAVVVDSQPTFGAPSDPAPAVLEMDEDEDEDEDEPDDDELDSDDDDLVEGDVSEVIEDSSGSSDIERKVEEIYADLHERRYRETFEKRMLTATYKLDVVDGRRHVSFRLVNNYEMPIRITCLNPVYRFDAVPGITEVGPFPLKHNVRKLRLTTTHHHQILLEVEGLPTAKEIAESMQSPPED